MPVTLSGDRAIPKHSAANPYQAPPRGVCATSQFEGGITSRCVLPTGINVALDAAVEVSVPAPESGEWYAGRGGVGHVWSRAHTVDLHHRHLQQPVHELLLPLLP